MSIATLLEAADFIERREREQEHGYAIVSLPVLVTNADVFGRSHKTPQQSSLKFKVKKHFKARKNGTDRSTHNELEKNRRAHLRSCLERLREEVPPGGDASRHTTLGLLTRARDYIRALEEKDRMNYRYREQLAREQRLLLERLGQAQTRCRWRPTKLRASNSCSSSSSVSSCGSSASSGYATSEAPDSDDTSSGTRSPAELEGATSGINALAMTAGPAVRA